MPTVALSTEQVRAGQSPGDLEDACLSYGTPRSSRPGTKLGTKPGSVDKVPAGKRIEIRGRTGHRSEINGVYVPLQESWSGVPLYRNRRTQVYIVWHAHPARWKIIPKIGSTRTLAYASCPCGRNTLPCAVAGPWFIVTGESEAGPVEEADESVECTFLGQTVVVSGRSGHNQRLNGVFTELLEPHGAFPAYMDRRSYTYLYRRPDRASWVISNCLGPARRLGRGIVFAEVEDDARLPFQVRRPWTVSAWGSHLAEEDPNIRVVLRAGIAREGPPPAVLAIHSTIHPGVAGSYALQGGKHVNGHMVYVRAGSDASPDKFLFWEGGCWCIGGATTLRRQECDVCSQQGDATGRNHPDDAAWSGIDVLRGGCIHIEASLLATLRGRISAVSKQFS